MQTCPQCNTPNRDEAKFCASCGTPLETQPEAKPACPACGAENEADAKFCEDCGAALQQAPASPPAPKPASEPEPSPAEVPQVPSIPPAAQPQAQEASATVACPQCGTDNDSEAKFCRSCGADLQQVAEPPAEAELTPSPVESQAEPSTSPEAQAQAQAVEPATLTCPSCGAENDSDAKFCGSCGADLQQAPAPSADAQPAPEPASTPPAQPPAKAESVSEGAPATPSTGHSECPSCGYIVHYCPSCGTPMQTDPQPPGHTNPQQHQGADTQ